MKGKTMFTIRVQYEGELLSEHEFDPKIHTWGALEEFNQVVTHVEKHYALDTSGITVDVFDESGTVTLSHTFA